MALMTVKELETFLHSEMPQMFRDTSIAIERADGRTCRLRETYDESMLRPGGTVSGPTLMALADFAMYVVLLSAIGPVGLAVTTNLNINFLSKAPAGHDLIAEARLMKLGKRLAVGEVTLYSAAGSEPVAHVTSTYSIPPKRD
ncbi:PaaI family thioesterase [Bradyrhizobium sp. LHD-71]|uniref:PaaI family thioesterase n=1 Tax=Bradyrhizobium sp. LHD-71 TaxID=3072141 RepID=UPI00280DE223|nr:PaaI family thioesterase [Bradyrhizobium sp. LHD-71]MDQ8726102.1 PaaI family thioesterase [Bradyrhizobium sp. LHD-71]